MNKDLILRVAKNARLMLTSEEAEEFVPEFKEILEAFSVLNELDLGKGELSMHPLPLRNALREDIPEPSLSREEILSNTKHKKDGYFLGPKAL